jgi:glycosyltransferase involved in cell wall biosynthesis
LVLASTYPRWKDDPEPGFIHELCKRLSQRFAVVAVVPDAPGADASGEFEGVQVVRYRYAPRRWQTLVNNGGVVANLRRSPWKWLLLPTFVAAQYLAARKALRHRQVAIIHAHWLLPQGLIATLLGHAYRTPYVVTSHGGDLFGLRGTVLSRLKRKVAESSAAMTVVSSAMVEESNRIGLRPPRLCVLPMGADMHGRFTPQGEPVPSPDELLFVGRLVEKKGLPYLLDALPQVVRARPSTFLTIAGFGPDEDALKAQAARLGIGAQVRFLGAVAQRDLPNLYRRAALLVAPFIRDASGNQEGLPVVLMEAIACGCPVLPGRVAGVDDLLGAAGAILSVDPTDTSALASAILAILAAPTAARQRALELRESVVKRVDWSVIAESYGDLLARCAVQPESIERDR